ELLRLARAGPLRSGLWRSAGPCARARQLPLLRMLDVDAGIWAPAKAGVVQGWLEGRLRDRCSVRRRDPRQRLDVVGLGALPDLRPRRALLGHLGALRPEHR